ncbi:hypothetical protein [Shewanella sp. YLB-07]|uniref:hypothetical protein n=1 Tax=Shewanella sp. YLB-07 TaxID=2601268 RepID=UPI00128D7912|nr:hypothetical protein [Shewanella sp. YLB-07]MPY23214.1 hypothetical protein [Shewanella sp. YLB-07]
MNERKIALWALIITFLGWVGIKPDHFISAVLWLWELIKTLFIILSDIFTFSINIPISLLIIISVICFKVGKIHFKNNSSVGEEPHGVDETDEADNSEPLSDLSERQQLVLLDIYSHAGPHKGYGQIMRKLRIDSHMLNQTIEQLIELGYLVMAGRFGQNYPVLSKYGRDVIIQFVENQHQSN